MLRNKADGRIDLVKLYKTLLDIAAGMQYLHSANILHGAHSSLQEKMSASGLGVRVGTLWQNPLPTYCLLAVAGDLKLGNILLKSTATDLRGGHTHELEQLPCSHRSICCCVEAKLAGRKAAAY